MALFNFGNKTETPPEPASAPDSAVPESKETPKEAPTGLDKFANLFDNEDEKGAKKEGEEEAVGPFDPIALLNNDEAVETLLSKVDFTSAISKETQQKLASNAEDALPSMMQDVTKAAYLHALKSSVALTTKMVEDKLSEHSKTTSSQIDNTISDRELASALPEINNPIIKAGTKPYIAAFRKQNPSANATDIANYIREILREVNTTVNPETPEVKKSSNEVDDWLEELNITL